MKVDVHYTNAVVATQGRLVGSAKLWYGRITGGRGAKVEHGGRGASGGWKLVGGGRVWIDRTFCS
jgi:hypothetical protein